MSLKKLHFKYPIFMLSLTLDWVSSLLCKYSEEKCQVIATFCPFIFVKSLPERSSDAGNSKKFELGNGS